MLENLAIIFLALIIFTLLVGLIAVAFILLKSLKEWRKMDKEFEDFEKDFQERRKNMRRNFPNSRPPMPMPPPPEK